MRYLLLLPLFVVLLASCAKTDKELVTGTWAFYELKGGPEGKLVFSVEKEKQPKIIEDMIKTQKEMFQGMPVDENVIRDNSKKQFANMEKITFTFKEDGKLKIEAHQDDKSLDQETKYTLDDKKKELVIKSDAREVKYKYSFNDDKFVWKGEDEELTLYKKD